MSDCEIVYESVSITVWRKNQVRPTIKIFDTLRCLPYIPKAKKLMLINKKNLPFI